MLPCGGILIRELLTGEMIWLRRNKRNGSLRMIGVNL